MDNILNRLNDKITSHVLPETQGRFRNNQNTMNMVFSLRQIQEKCAEQNLEMYAFDTVSRERLWLVLNRFGCTEKVINLIKALHNGMQAKVVQYSEASHSHKWSKARMRSRSNIIFIAPYRYTRCCLQKFEGRDLHTDQTRCRLIQCFTFLVKNSHHHTSVQRDAFC